MPQLRKHPFISLLAGSLAVLASLLLAVPATAAESPGPHHDVFWALEGPQGQAGYLLGTVHSEDARVLEFTAPFLESLGQCDRFAMELVPDLVTMQRLLDYMQLAEDESLAAMAGDERFQAVRAALQSYGVPDDQVTRMKPWAAMMSLSLPPPKTGLFLDFQLSLRASGSGLEVLGLETLEEQLSFLENLSLQQQLELLDQALADHARVQEIHDLMVDSYLYRPLDDLMQVAAEQMDSLEPATRRYFQEEGIDARNRRMVDKALPLLTEGCTFIAVGALHLPGEAGMLDLLEAAGYRPQPMPSPFVVVAGTEPES